MIIGEQVQFEGSGWWRWVL